MDEELQKKADDLRKTISVGIEKFVRDTGYIPKVDIRVQAEKLSVHALEYREGLVNFIGAKVDIEISL